MTFDLSASGQQVEAVMDRIRDNISLDHMARLLVDVQQDSSGIVDSIISQHQRELLNLIFLGDAPNRNKVIQPCSGMQVPVNSQQTLQSS